MTATTHGDGRQRTTTDDDEYDEDDESDEDDEDDENDEDDEDDEDEDDEDEDDEDDEDEDDDMQIPKTTTDCNERAIRRRTAHIRRRATTDDGNEYDDDGDDGDDDDDDDDDNSDDGGDDGAFSDTALLHILLPAVGLIYTVRLYRRRSDTDGGLKYFKRPTQTYSGHALHTATLPWCTEAHKAMYDHALLLLILVSRPAGRRPILYEIDGLVAIHYGDDRPLMEATGRHCILGMGSFFFVDRGQDFGLG